MSSDFGSLRKILKYETSREVLILLNDKGALSSDELMNILDVPPRLIAYELKVLDDFLVKTNDEKYTLSENGKQAYTLLNNLPKSFSVSRRWKITWLVATISCFVFSFFLRHIFDIPITIIMRLLFMIMFCSAVFYVLNVKPKSIGRFFYIGLGVVVLGCFLWLLLLKVNRGTFFAGYPPGSTGDHITGLLSLVVCYVIGGVIGEFIGKKMQYKFPPSFHSIL